jgi:hypothetical protein
VDLDNTITLSISPISTVSSVSIVGGFGPARHLLIKPGAPLVRVSVVSPTPGVAIFDLAATGHIVIQDLDILRNVTNNYHLVVLSSCESVVIERCRIGSNWTTPGSNGWSNIELLYPTEVILRNNIFFAYRPATFDRGIHAFSFNDPANSLRLYNNVVSDYDLYGIHIEAVIPGPLIVLRNNVAVNHTSFLAEPTAYRSDAAIGGPTIATSHNTAYATVGFVELIPGGNQDIAGLPAASQFLRFNRIDVIASFLTRDWSTAPPWDFNPNYYRLTPGGPLHMNAGQYGFTVTNVAPDVAVVDDIDKQIRPSGAGPHTDRGVDQIEKGTAAGVDDHRAGNGLTLQASARQNPSKTLVLDYRSEAAGRLTLEVFDVAGRRLSRTERVVGEAGAGSIEAAVTGRGVVIYRLRLEPPEGEVVEVSGKAVLVR